MAQSSVDDGLGFPSPSPTTSPSTPSPEIEVNVSLKDLQSDEHRQILDVVAQLRKCGLENILPLPQIVVCGDQSSGKSSSLEAITEIPFEQSDNLCTRFATEIHLRTTNDSSITVRVIPDPSRSSVEQAAIKNFVEKINNFNELPRIMDLAKGVMGITKVSDSQPRAFARDVLSIEYCSPDSPQLTLVDIPGLIATSTKGITKEDVDLVAEITDHYIKQPRTICLAVVSATNDYANQRILEKVREFDPEGNRTLGVITKPDGLAAGSGSENGYLELARNKDVFFKLGWHVLKNRKYEERNFSLEERNHSEALFFKRSNFKTLPKENVGIDALKVRLSVLLFEHIKNELPKLKQDLEKALSDTREPLHALGKRRSSPSECKAYLSRRSMEFYDICRAAVNGHYEGKYFHKNIDPTFSLASPSTICRTRAVIQQLNSQFARELEKSGHKYHIDMEDNTKRTFTNSGADEISVEPIKLVKSEAIGWVRQVLIRTRGKELPGNFNPLLIGELFWDQSSRWGDVAEKHVEKVSNVCTFFLKNLLHDECPKDVASRVWASLIEDKLTERKERAFNYLALLVKENKNFPINYDHYYSESIQKAKMDRHVAILEKCVSEATSTAAVPGFEGNEAAKTTSVDIHKAVVKFSESSTKDMDDYACEEALDCLFAIYKVFVKYFIADITRKVVERHIVGELEEIFCPVVVNDLSDTQALHMASEPSTTMRHRAFLEDRIKSLEEGQKIFRSVM